MDIQFNDNQSQFLVKWKGYSDEFNSWVSENDLNECDKLISEFYETVLYNSDNSDQSENDHEKDNYLTEQIIIENVSDTEIKIGYYDGLKVYISQLNINSSKLYHKINKAQNKSIQLTKKIQIPISSGEIVHLHDNMISEYKFNFDFDKLFSEYSNYMTSFLPKIKREKPPTSQVTVDTHIRNIKRYFKFTHQYYTHIINEFFSFDIEDPLSQIIHLDLIKIYIQHLLDKSNSGHYIKLIIRSFISFIIFIIKKTNCESLSMLDKDFYSKSQFKQISIISELATIQTSIQHEYIYYRSREELEELNKWISLQDLISCSKEFHQNFENWVSYLSPFEIPKSLSKFNLDSSFLKSYWSLKFYYHLSNLQQSSLLLNLLCSIPTPRPSNIRSICFKFVESDSSIINHHIEMINNSVSTLLEIKGLDPDLVSIINEYLSLLFSFEEFKIISPQKKLILKSNLFFQKEPIDLKFSMTLNPIFFQLFEYYEQFSKFYIDFDSLSFQIRYLRYKTQTSSSHEDVVFPINSKHFKMAFFQFIQPFWGLSYLLLFPQRKLNSVSRSNFFHLFQSHFFPLWIDSESNVFLSDKQYSKSLDIKFQIWFSRASFNVTGKQITFTTLRKSMVTRSREEKWERDEQAALSRVMLHSLHTADRVYTKTPSSYKSASIISKFQDN